MLRCTLLALICSAWGFEVAIKRHRANHARAEKTSVNQTALGRVNRSSSAVSATHLTKPGSATAVAHDVSSKREQALFSATVGVNLKVQHVNNASHASDQIACGRHLQMHPSQVSCPGACPYLRAEPTRLCEFKCVAAKDCGDDNPLTSFANPESLRCEACLVAACHLCTESSKNECAECHSGFELTNGQCISIHRRAWHCFYSFILILAGVVVLYFVQLLRRKLVNLEPLKHGMDFRYLSSIRNPESGSQWSLKETDLQRNPRPAGLATMLHFRFMGMAMVWGLIIMIVLLIFGAYFQQRPKALRSYPENTFNACNQNVQDAKEHFLDMETFYFFVTVFIYLASTAGSLFFAKRQRQSWEAGMADTDTMGQFALVTKGFPILDGSKNVEKDFEAFLRQAPQFEGLNIVGVSVCWNYRDKKKEIDEQIEFEQSKADVTAWGESINSARTLDDEEGAKRNCFDPELRCVDYLLGVGNMPCVKSKKEELPDVIEVLDSLKTTEYVFIIFETPHQAAVAKECVDAAPLKYEGSDIHLYDHDFEPLTVLWDGWGCPRQEFHMRIAVGWLIIISAILLLDIFFYAPYVQYIMSYSDVAGMSQGGFVTGTLLGMLITVCNQIIYQVITLVAQSCGWCNSDKKMRFYVIQYTLAVLFNTCVDLWTVIILARGYQVDESLQRQAVDDSTMSAKALAESPSIQRALYIQMVAYIFPSCLLLPFLLEPLVAAMAPYYIGRSLVGSRKDVSIQDAEGCLQMQPYDLSRYGDVLVNIMLCCMMFAFTYPNLWQIWLYFLISMAVIYTWDKIRLLRLSFRSYYSSDTMEKAVQGMSALPCGILAACVAFRIYGAKHKGFLEALTTEPSPNLMELGGTEILVEAFGILTRHTIVPICVGTFFVHCLIHWSLLNHFVYDSTEDADVKQTDAADLERTRSAHTKSFDELASAMPASWFTINPVHCLRSKYKYSKDPKYSGTDNPPCSYYQIGKPFLIKSNPKVGVFFEYNDRSVNIPDYEERNEPVSFRERCRRFVDGFGHNVRMGHEPSFKSSFG